MVTFLEMDGSVFRHLLSVSDGAWVINCDAETAPQLLCTEAYIKMKHVPVPEFIVDETRVSEKRRKTMEKRMRALKPLLNNPSFISDSMLRKTVINARAKELGMSERTLMRYFYAFLARGERGLAPAKKCRTSARVSQEQKKMTQALNKYFYSSRKMSLPMTYEMMLLDSFRTKDGIVSDERPSYSQFKYHFYKTRSMTKEIITRDGLGMYQKNFRPLTGNGDSGITKIGLYEMDATEADIYIVSRYDRKPIGRPVIYLAVDVASRLIAGVHVGLEGTGEAVLRCLANAAEDKVAFCAEYGIEITKEMWPSCGLPSTICTDRGTDFLSEQVKGLCNTFGMEAISLPAYRPDLKGYVEKAFDCIQKRYKPLLRGCGVVDADAGERGAPDYYGQARLDLVEFTKVVIECVIFYNSAFVLQSYVRQPEMAAAETKAISSQIWKWLESNGQDERIRVESSDIRLMALPKADATLSRKGVCFNCLYYSADDMAEDMVRAGVRGGEKVQIAYDPIDDSCIYVIDDGVYNKLSLTLASAPYAKLSYAEVSTLVKEESDAKKTAAEEQIDAAVSCNQNILNIRASAERTEPHSRNDIKSEVMRQRRKNEQRMIKQNEKRNV